MKIKRLKQAQKFLSLIPNINDGGCGISALALYRWIKNNSKIENTKFVFLYNYDEEGRYLNNSRVLRDKDGEAEAPTHCCLLYKGEFIDSDGKKKIGGYGWIQIIDEEEFITRALDNVCDWNSRFDRGWINDIEVSLEIDLEVFIPSHKKSLYRDLIIQELKENIGGLFKNGGKNDENRNTK